MPRRLSDPEWVAFQNEIDVAALRLPPWGGVVDWHGQLILVYVCQGSGTLCQKGEVMLTDVSDRSDLISQLPRTYDSWLKVFIYEIPQAVMAQIFQVAKTTLTTTGQVIHEVAETVGEAAGAATEPLLSNLAVPLIVIGIVFLLTQMRRT